MSKQYIRVKNDGFIYDYSDRLAAHPDCEVISEQEAYPERFITPFISERINEVVQPKRGRKPSKGLDLATDIPDEPVYTDPELAAEAAKGWPE